MAVRLAGRPGGAALVAVLVVGCSPAATSTPAGTSPSTPPATSAVPSAGSSPRASSPPSSGVAGSAEPRLLAFPDRSEARLELGRYRSQPPFDVPFTFDVPDEGWETGHLHGEFFDLLRDIGPDRVPGEWLAFAHPVYLGEAPGTPATGLSPDDAIALLADRSDLAASEPASFSLDGRTGRRLDLHATAPDSKVFGGADGAFGMSSDLDLRLGAVGLGDDLLLVLVLAPPARLDEAWQHVQPILDSVDL